MTRAIIFDAIKQARGGKGWSQPEIALIDGLLTRLGVPDVKAGTERTTSATGRARIRDFEGTKLTAYPDPATGGDPWTIGTGHTGPDVYRGLTITVERADELLQADLRRFEAGVNLLAPMTTQTQFDALVSLAFNIGLANFGESTLLKKHNAADYAGAADQFARWNRANNKVMAGLTKRREAEAAMYRGQAR